MNARVGRLIDILMSVIMLLMISGIVAVPVIGVGLALGYGLRALIPGLELGWAIVAGAIFVTGIADMTARLLLAVRAAERAVDEDEDEEEEEEEEEGPDEPWVTIPRHFVPPARSGRKRGKRKR